MPNHLPQEQNARTIAVRAALGAVAVLVTVAGGILYIRGLGHPLGTISVLVATLMVAGVLVALSCLWPITPRDPRVYGAGALGGVLAVVTLLTVAQMVISDEPPEGKCPSVKLGEIPHTSWFVNPTKRPGSDVHTPTVCAVNVNRGEDVGQDFNLAGFITGEIPASKTLLLLVRPDRGTCNLLGDHGTGSYYFVRRLQLGAWNQDVHIGHFDDLPILRHYHFVLVDDRQADILERGKQNWKAKNAKNPNDGYPGVGDVEGSFLFDIDVQPVVPAGTKKAPCKPLT